MNDNRHRTTAIAMTYKRGFDTVQLVIFVVILGMVGAAAVVAHSWHQAELERARVAGAAQERLKWEAREREQEETYAAELKRLRAARDAELGELEDELHAADVEHQRRLTIEKAKSDRVAADLRGGRLVLRDPGRSRAPAGEARSGQGSADPAAPGSCNADEAGQLSGDLAEFLWGEAGRADETAEQLTYAQDVIRAYYELARACHAQEGTP